MKKFLLIAVVVAGLVYVVTQTVFASKFQELLSGVSDKLPTSLSFGKKVEQESVVLGDMDVDTSTGRRLPDVQEKVVQALEPVASTIVTVYEQITHTQYKDATQSAQKIELEKAVEEVKQRAGEIPGEVFERAKYEYCREVVKDYETRQE